MIKSIIAGGMLLILFGCSSVSVTTDYDPALDFNKYKTFAVFKDAVQGSFLENAPLIKARVLDAVEKSLSDKGMLETEMDKADLIVYPFAGTKEKMNITDWGYSYGRYWRGNPYGRNIDVNSYTEASLVLDLVDNKSDELIWRGVGIGTINPNKSPEERTKAIDEAVSKILGKFPPSK